MRATIPILAIVSAASGLVVPALGSERAQSSASIATRVHRLESKIRSTQSQIRALRAQVQSQGHVTFTRVTAPVSEAAPGVIPHWLQGQANCPAGTSVTGGGVRWNGTHGDNPRIQSSAPENNGWRGVIELDAVTTATTVGVYAICATS
jgi:hypothetical protein